MPSQVSVAKLDQEHVEFTTFKKAWEKIDLLNECGERLKQNAQYILTKRAKEPNDMWQRRLHMFFSTPVLGVPLGWYESALFRRQPEVDTPGDDFYTQFLANCDRQGTKFIDQGKRIFRDIMQFGRAWIMVDAPSADAQPQSLLEEQMMGLDSPYSIIRDPREVINWSTDEFGNLEWVLTRTLEDASQFLSDDKPKMVWCYYDRKGYQRYEAEMKDYPTAGILGNKYSVGTTVANLVDEGPHVLSAYNTVPYKLMTVPPSLWLANRIYLMCLNYLDTENSHAWNLHQANLSMPIIKAVNMPDLTLAEAGIIHIQPDEDFGWTEPAGHSFKASEDRLNALREEIYRSVYLIAAGRSSNSTASMQSGFSKTLDWAPANDVLNAYGDLMRAGLESVLRMVAFARKDESAKFFVRGFHFETKDATAAAALGEEIAASFTALNTPVVPKTVRIEVMKRIARDVLEDSGEDVLKQAAKDIDAMPEPEDMLAQQADQLMSQSFGKLTDRHNAETETASASSET